MKPEKPIPPLFLYSLSEFSSLIRWLLDSFKIRSIVEIGAEYGQLTQELIKRLCDGHLDRVTIIDPSPQSQLETLLHGIQLPEGSVELRRETSLEALEQIPPADCYLIDGDHNYYTVLHELLAIEKQRGSNEPFPLVLLHDVGWPCARRDMYYAPQNIPKEWLHDHDFHLGTVLDEDCLVTGGFRSNGNFAFAKVQGGQKNGVLTAVEDFLASRPHIGVHQVPAILGLGVLYPRNDEYTRLFESSTYLDLIMKLLSHMERNRMALYLKVLDLQDQLQVAQENIQRLSHLSLLEMIGHWLRRLIGYGKP